LKTAQTLLGIAKGMTGRENQVWSDIWAKFFDLSQSPSASEPASFERGVRYMTASSRRLIRSARSRAMEPLARRSAAAIATGFSCRDQDHRRALQPLRSGKLPRADRHDLGLRPRLG